MAKTPKMPLLPSIGQHMNFASSRLFARYAAFFLAVVILIEPGLTGQIALARGIRPGQGFIGRMGGTDDAGFDFSLKPATSESATAEKPATVSSGTPLAPGRLQEMLKQMPALPAAKEGAFVIPEQSLVKPPLPGDQTVEAFPPKEVSTPRPATDQTKRNLMPLTITRVSPTGPAEDVREVEVDFSQPMVPLQQAGNVDGSNYVNLVPKPQGQWHWSGTQTLIFSPGGVNKRLPKATDYALNVPLTTRSIDGKGLSEPYSAKVETPPLTISAASPSMDDPQSDRPLIFLAFNQHIDRAKVFSYLLLRTGTKTFELEAVPESEFVSFGGKTPYPVAVTDRDSFIAVRPKSPLPLDTLYYLVLKAGCPSSEGPKTTQQEQVDSVRVHGPLTLIKGPTDPIQGGFSGFSFCFNNQLKSKKSDMGNLVQITPEIKHGQVQSSGQYISINGEFKSFQKYTITISGDLTDVFGQKLGKNISTVVNIGPKPVSLRQDQRFVTVSPEQKPQLSFYAQGTDSVKLKIFRVRPEDWLAFQTANYQAYDWQKDKDLGDIAIGDLLHQEDRAIGNEGIDTEVNLKPYLKDGHGQFIVVGSCPSGQRSQMLRFASFVQVTELGINAFKGKKFNVLVTELANGRPVSGAKVTILSDADFSISGQNGVASINYASGARGQSLCLAAVKGSDAAILPNEYQDWSEPGRSSSVIWHCISDRGLYKPGQTVNVKGWQRGLRHTENGAIEIFDSKIKAVNYVVSGRNGEKLASGSCTTDTVGAFNYAFAIPQKVDLGTVSIRMSANPSAEAGLTLNQSWEAYLGVEVQDYRRPEFEMKASTSTANMLVGESAVLTARAAYFGGGSLPDTAVRWAARASAYYFTPPNCGEYQFGVNDYRGFIQVVKKVETVSNKDGASSVSLRVDKNEKPVSISFQCEATFTDLNRQSWSDTTNVVVHPGKVFIGTKYKVDDKNENVEGHFIVCDDAGKAVVGRPIHITLVFKNGDGEVKEVASADSISKDKPIDFKFALPDGEQFVIKASTTDSDGKRAIVEQNFGINRYDGSRAKFAANSAGAVEISADRTEYKAGQTALITLKSSVVPAEGLLFVSRQNLRDTIPIKFEKPTTTVSLPISEADYPNLRVQAVVNGQDSHHATGEATLSVPPSNRTLALKVVPEKGELAPGSKTHINVELLDHAGTPVENGHVAIVVVDESLLALRNNVWTNPVADFYPANYFVPLCGFSRNSVYYPQTENSRNAVSFLNGFAPARGLAQLASADGSLRKGVNLFQAEPTALDERHFVSGRAERHQMTAAAAPMAGAVQPFVTRVNFSELALFAPDVVTDKSGKAVVELTLPDSTTKYRVMAIAVSDLDKFGSAENSISTKMALSIKPSLPRFLNFGDKCELPFVVQNQSDNALDADVAVRTQNFKDVQSSGLRVNVPAHSRVEVRFAAFAGAQGEMLVQSAASAGDLSDAAVMTIPVMVPATFEAFAAYGQIDKGAALQKLTFPKDVFDQFGGLTVSTSSTALQGLTDAYMDLVNYRYNCSEQLSARMLSMLALHDSLAAFHLLSDAGEVAYQSKVNDDIKLLVERQFGTGGFGLWTALEEDKDPYTSLQVIKALLAAKTKGFAVEQRRLDLGTAYLKDIRSHIPSEWSQQCKDAIVARALQIRHSLGDDDIAEAKAILLRSQTLFAPKNAESNATAVEMSCWLLPVLYKADSATEEVQAMRRVINNSLVETASTASTNFKQYDSWFYLLYSSGRKIDGEILDMLVECEPDNELVVKLVKGLLGHRKKGAWNGTQENYIILQALDSYFKRFEKEVPEFVAREWLGDAFVGKQSFVGRTTESKSVEIPTKYILSHIANDVLITKVGPGRLYYRLGIDYVPRNLNLKALSLGFDVAKTYEGINAKDDVSKDADGVWHFKAGATIKCKVHFANIGTRYHVALMAPLPAGCEPVNGALAGNQTITEDTPEEPVGINYGHRFRWWHREWFEHQNLRDHQAEAFASYLYAGEHDYSYTMRATTPGRYVVPPTKAEEMYDEETFGRTGTENVVVE